MSCAKFRSGAINRTEVKPMKAVVCFLCEPVIISKPFFANSKKFPSWLLALKLDKLSRRA